MSGTIPGCKAETSNEILTYMFVFLHVDTSYECQENNPFISCINATALNVPAAVALKTQTLTEDFQQNT